MIASIHDPVRPLWSVMIPVYNAGSYLEETLLSVLQQALSESDMQIEVVDDCSTDQDVAQIVKQISNGRVTYYRQESNIGSLRNFETCLNRSRGKYIHLLHSDDLVHDGFYRKLTELFTNFPQAAAAFCAYRYITENGSVEFYPEKEALHDSILDNWLVRLAQRQRIQYVCIAVKREIYEELGGFCGVHYGEDWEMWARIARKYPFAYSPEVLASYRRHQNSISGQSIITARNLRDLEFVMEKINNYLPAAERKRALRSAKKFYAHYAVRTAKKLWINFRNRKGAVAQIRKGWEMYKDPLLVYDIAKVFARMILNR